MKKRISASFGIMLIAALLTTALPVNTFGAFEISGSETTGSEFEDRLYDEESMDAGTVPPISRAMNWRMTPLPM